MQKSPVQYLDRALDKLSTRNLMPNVGSQVPALGTLKQIESVDPDGVLAIGRTLQHESEFSQVVRENISGMEVADRYEKITQGFNSIRADSKRMVQQMDKGKLSMTDRVGNLWMRTRRGSVASRFDDICKTYLDVTRDTQKTIENERAIIEAYGEYRLALKQAEVNAHEVHSKAAAELDAVQSKFSQANDAVSEAESGGDQKAIAEAQLARDELRSELQTAQKREQIAKDLAENLQISYNTSEAIMGRLQQTIEVKERVYEQSVVFFSTNESVFTQLSASMTALHGLHESAESLEAMKKGANDSLQDMATIGTEVMTRAQKSGYGPTINAESVKMLVDSIVSFQEQTQTNVKQLRQQATENANQIREYTEQGKQRYAQLLNAER